MKIAILGGSFNPIHNGHLSIVNNILANKLVDEVWIMPCKKHSFDKKLEDSFHRVEMIKLAIKNNSKIKLCDFELNQEGNNYTSKTISELRKIYTHDFFLIIGSDILSEIKKWHNFEELAKNNKFIVFKREGYEIINPGINITAKIDLKEKNISSTQVREAINNKQEIAELVQKEVEEYIRKNDLYKN